MKKETLLTEQAKAFADTMPNECQIEFKLIRNKLEETGRLVAPYGEKVSGYDNLFAIRIKKGKNIRFFYCYDDGTYVWILNGYEKKSMMIPGKEIKKALNIKKELGL